MLPPVSCRCFIETRDEEGCDENYFLLIFSPPSRSLLPNIRYLPPILLAYYFLLFYAYDATPVRVERTRLLACLRGPNNVVLDEGTEGRR